MRSQNAISSPIHDDKTLLQHDGALRDLYRKLLPLLQPDPEHGPERKLGFSRRDGG